MQKLPENWGKSKGKPKNWNSKNELSKANSVQNKPQKTDDDLKDDIVDNKNDLYQREPKDINFEVNNVAANTPETHVDVHFEKESTEFSIPQNSDVSVNKQIKIIEEKDIPITKTEKPQKEKLHTEIEKKGRKSFGVKEITLIISVFVIIGLVVADALMFVKLDKNGGEDNNTTTETTTVAEVISTTEEAKSEIVTLPIDVNKYNYAGLWRIGNSIERELVIHDIESSYIDFSLYYYGLTSLDYVQAEISGNKASFTASPLGNSSSVIKGTITFDTTTVTVEITESDYQYIPLETMVFNQCEHADFWEVPEDDYIEEPSVNETTEFFEPEETTTEVTTEEETTEVIEPKKEMSSVSYNGILFEYPSLYEDEIQKITIDSLKVERENDFSNYYSLKISGNVINKNYANPRLCNFQYDDEGYFIKEDRIAYLPDGSFKNSYSVYVDNEARHVYIDVEK